MASAASMSPEQPRLWNTLLAAIAAGDEKAFAEFYDVTKDMIHGLIWRILRDPGKAEEVTHDVYLYVWRNAQRYDAGRGQVYTWLVTIARTRAIDRLRETVRDRESCTVALDELLELRTESPGPEHAAELAAWSRKVGSALSAIPQEQRELIELAFFDGHTQSEIADRTALPLGTVKTRIRSGMIKLRDLLAGQR